MSKHTPGPWVVEGWDVREPDGCVINEGLQVVAIKNGAECSIYAATECGDGDEMEANLHLIAAAPELLAALEFLMAAHGEQLDTAFSQANLAIAKAKGIDHE